MNTGDKTIRLQSKGFPVCREGLGVLSGALVAHPQTVISIRLSGRQLDIALMRGNGLTVPVKIEVDESQRVMDVPGLLIDHKALLEHANGFVMLPFTSEQLAKGPVRFDLHRILADDLLE